MLLWCVRYCNSVAGRCAVLRKRSKHDHHANRGMRCAVLREGRVGQQEVGGGVAVDEEGGAVRVEGGDKVSLPPSLPPSLSPSLSLCLSLSVCLSLCGWLAMPWVSVSVFKSVPRLLFHRDYAEHTGVRLSLWLSL
eukprot:2146643-Rhodomonas_salina.1